MNRSKKIISLIEKIAQHGFDLTNISAKNWQKILTSVEAGNKANWSRYGWEWSGGDILIVTGNNPITGEYALSKNRGIEKDYAGYIGIEGNPDKVKTVVSGIKKYADSIKGESKGGREFI